jgi:hypothetical protein
VYHKILPGILAALALAGTAHAQNVLYDNTTTPIFRNALTNRNATDVAGIVSTNVIADRIIFASGSAGQSILTFTFSTVYLASGNSSVYCRPLIYFWQTDGVGGAPGTLINRFAIEPVPEIGLRGVGLEGGRLTLLPWYAAPGALVVPSSGDMWVGLAYDNDTNSSGLPLNNNSARATVAQLNLMTQFAYGPPTVGSSDDSHWVSAAGSSNLMSNPAGTLINSPFGGTPVANYGWRFEGAATAPEPGSLTLLGLGGLGVLGALRRRRA